MKEITCNVKGLIIGGHNPIVVQSMCNTDTNDIKQSIQQCIDLHNAGSQLIRLTTQGLREVESLRKIKEGLIQQGIHTPLVADVHFNSDVALAVAAGVADKVRINPGNFSKDHNIAMSKFKELIEICRQYGTALRIGLNHGSLGERITNLYGDTPNGMCQAVMEWLKICVEQEFHNVVISLKASNTKVMIEAYRLLRAEMESKLGMIFPLHLGVTEAGNGDSARIKSAVGIGTLLNEGIGDTIRVSLTENPVNEIPIAQMLAHLGEASRDNLPGEREYKSDFTYDCDSWDEYIVKASYQVAPALIDGKSTTATFSGTIAGKEITQEQKDYLLDELLQACRLKFTKPEYIACPSCGRTLYDIEGVLARIKKATSQFVGVKIAVMGCIVNGPGEMADADFGYVGEGRGKITLYRGKEPVIRGIPQEEAVEKLVELIKANN